MSRYLATSLVAAVAIGAGVYFYMSSKAAKPSASTQEKETSTQVPTPVSETVETPVASETPVATPVPLTVSYSALFIVMTQLIALILLGNPRCRKHQDR